MTKARKVRLRRALSLALIGPILAAALTGGAAADTDVHPDPSLDLTPVYEAFIEDGRFDRGRIETRFDETARGLKAMRILVAPSWLSDTAFAAAESGAFDYLGEQLGALRGAGIEVELAATDSEASVAENARIILGQIEKSPEPVCIVSHSKGGLDVLEALAGAKPAVLEKVRCWVALQAPFAGSPMADLAADNVVVRQAAARLLAAMGGSEQSLIDLTVEERRRYLAEQADRIDRALSRIKVLSFASYVEDPGVNGFPANLGAKIMSWAAEREMRSDGLVPVKSAILPHTHYVVARGVDHAMTVSDKNPLTEDLDRVLLIKLLLNMVLQLPEDPPVKT